MGQHMYVTAELHQQCWEAQRCEQSMQEIQQTPFLKQRANNQTGPICIEYATLQNAMITALLLCCCTHFSNPGMPQRTHRPLADASCLL